MAAYVGQDDFLLLCGGYSFSEFLHFNSRRNSQHPCTAILHDAIHDVNKNGYNYDFRENMGSTLHASGDFGDNVAEYVADTRVSQDVEAGTRQIKLQELRELHFHAAGEWWRHAVDTGNKFCK